jgi:hypothetical protein
MIPDHPPQLILRFPKVFSPDGAYALSKFLNKNRQSKEIQKIPPTIKPNFQLSPQIPIYFYNNFLPNPKQVPKSHQMIKMKDTNQQKTRMCCYRKFEEGDGSPLNKPCTTTYCLRTADRKSTFRQISKPAGAVTLYLIPQKLAKKIREPGESFGIDVRRTRGHNYSISMITSAKGGRGHEF